MGGGSTDPAGAFRRNEEEYKLLFEKMLNGVALHEIVVDGEGRPVDYVFLEVNEAFERLTGLDRKTLVGKKVSEALPGIDEDPSDWIDAYGSVALTGAEVRFERHSQQLDRWYSVVAFRTRERQFATVFEDITERKQAEMALRESEGRLRFLTDHMADIIWTSDMELRTTYVSPSIEAVLGFTPEERRHQSAAESITPASLMEVFQRFAEELELARSNEDQSPDRAVTMEVEYLKKDGSTVWLESTMKWIRDDRGALEGIHGVSRDITERKRAAAALRESEERLRVLFDSSPDFLMLLDREHKVRLINRVEAGTTEEDVIGAPLYELVGPAARLQVKQHLDRVVADGVEQQYDTLYTRPDGVEVHFSSVVAPLLMAGEVTGSVVSSRDVTAFFALREEKDRLEEQYRQSQKMEAIGRLAGGVAHDFNNLLTVIRSYASFVLNDLRRLNPIRSDVEQIVEAADRAATLTRQLLAFSRKQVLEPKILDLNEVVCHLEGLLRRVIGEDVEFTTELDGDLALVNADPGQIEQVLMNLVINARDAMPSGGRLSVATTNVTEDAHAEVGITPTLSGPCVMLTVTDTGSGMSDEVRERIFEPFFTTKEKSRGTGLGLATVYGIVEQSGGTIRVESRPGRGSRFQVLLPRVDAEQVERASVVDPDDLRGGETVLVVEDESAVRGLVERILTSAGYNVILTSNGEEALREHGRRRGEIDLVLTDVVMPKMSGKEMADRLAKTEGHVKLLYMSGYTDDAIADHGVLNEGAQLLSKPFTVDDLLRKVRSVLDGD